MKIATLTFQRHENIGAMLQCYALQKTIKSFNYDNEIIDYICDAADRPFCFQSLRVKGSKKYITSCIGVISRLPKKNALMKFRKKYFIMTHTYTSKTIKKLDDKYDGYIVGSDNVWNSKLTGLDPNYFLCFVSDNKKKASYAASLGMGRIPENERERFKQHLQSFSYISLREKAAAEDMSLLLNRKIVDTCDPTFFLLKSEWMELTIEPRERYEYVLVYHMSPSVSFVEFAREFAKIKGLRIIYIPFPYGICKCSIKPHIGPCEWLGYIKNAKYVITDSFHGCVFSTIFEKNLIIKISKLGERIQNLAQKLGIENRIVDTVADAVNLKNMDYTNIRNRIEDYRNNGKKTLNNILEEFSNYAMRNK